MKIRSILVSALLLGSISLIGVGCRPETPTRIDAKDGGHGAEKVPTKHKASAVFTPTSIWNHEPGHFWETKVQVDKYWTDKDAKLHRNRYAVAYAEHNLLCTAGITRLENLLIGTGSTQAYDQTHTRIGTGNGAGTAAAADTDLSAAAGSANRWFQLVDQVSTVSTNVLTIHATFGSSDGNYAWNEFGTDQGTASGNTVTAPLLNHKTSAALGTKTTGSWAITETITISKNFIGQYSLDA